MTEIVAQRQKQQMMQIQCREWKGERQCLCILMTRREVPMRAARV